MEKSNITSASLPAHPQLGWQDHSMPARVLGNAEGSDAGSAPPAGAARSTVIGMEGAVLYHKTIDNSEVAYRHDPRDRHSLSRQVSCCLFVALLILAIFAPQLWVRQSGYRQDAMAKQIETLKERQGELKRERGRLAELERVGPLAAMAGFKETDHSNFDWYLLESPENESRVELASLR